MLIATYALLTLSVEQKKERSFISRIQQYLHTNAEKPQEIDPARIEAQLDELTQFAESRHQLKVEGCLMPAVRKATREAGALLADLESLSRIGNDMLRSVRKCLGRAFSHGEAQIKHLCQTMDLYCQNLLERLAKEEQELLPLAQRVISSEGWFAIGTTFLSHDAGDDEVSHRPNAAPMRARRRTPAPGI